MVFVEISKGQAVDHLNKFDLVDPCGADTVQAVCQRGTAFKLETNSGVMVVVMQIMPPVLWVSAAAGFTKDATQDTLSAIEQYALKHGCSMVEFQTARPGLVKLAKKIGYSALPKFKGWTLKKEINNDH